MINVEWDMTPSWWGADWWKKNGRSGPRRDPLSVGYAIEAILDEVPQADVEVTPTKLLAKFRMEDEQMFLAQRLDRQVAEAEASGRAILDADQLRRYAPRTLDELRAQVMSFVEDICNPHQHPQPPYPTIELVRYGNEGEVRDFNLSLRGLELPGGGKTSTHHTTTVMPERSDAFALRQVFEDVAAFLTANILKEDPVDRRLDEFRERLRDWPEVEGVRPLVFAGLTMLLRDWKEEDAEREALLNALTNVADTNDATEALRKVLQAEDLEWKLNLECEAVGPITEFLQSHLGLTEDEVDAMRPGAHFDVEKD